MRSDIISLVVNIVVRRAKQEYRASIVTLCEPNEAALLAKVENIFNYLLLNQKHVLTLIKLLDFSFMLTAYIDCICNGATDEQSLERAPNNVEAELNFLNEHVANESVSRFVLHMRQQMNIRKWLPWYEEVSNIPNNVIFRLVEAASPFLASIPRQKCTSMVILGSFYIHQ